MHTSQKTVDELTSIYMSQSPAAFASVAMHAKAPNDHNARIDEEYHGGDSKCDYSCCSDRGVCNSWGWHACCAGGIVVCLACCCYCTHGFNGLWPYWPF